MKKLYNDTPFVNKKKDVSNAELQTQLAQNLTIKGTTQSIVFNTDGTVQKVQHKDSSSVVLREDVFTYESNLITEVRTLSSGGSVTFKYHLDTLETEVI